MSVIVEASIGRIRSIVDRVVLLRVTSSPIALHCGVELGFCFCPRNHKCKWRMLYKEKSHPPPSCSSWEGRILTMEGEESYRSAGREIVDNANAPARVDSHSVGTRLEA